MQAMVDAIRGAGSSHVILLGGLQYSNALTQWLAYRPNDPLGQLGAAWHLYNFNACVSATCWDDAPAAVAAARALGYRVAIVTNQSGIARGFYDWTGFAAVQAVIDAALARAGTAVDAVLACAYHGKGHAPYALADHFWRKPNPGMILEALRRLNGIAARSVMVGDKPDDIAAARAARLGRLVLVERAARAGATDADAVVRSLGDAVAWIARGAHQGAS